MSKKFAQEVIDVVASGVGDKQSRLNRVLEICEKEVGPKSSPKKKKEDPVVADNDDEAGAAA